MSGGGVLEKDASMITPTDDSNNYTVSFVWYRLCLTFKSLKYPYLLFLGLKNYKLIISDCWQITTMARKIER